MAERVVVIGRNGQLARELADLDWPEDTRAVFLGRRDIDFTRPQLAGALVGRLQPCAIINTAAHTEVDRAEGEPEVARFLNAEIPAVLADIARTLDIPILHVSTDYVFSGQRETPWSEYDRTAPLSRYGQTKRAGESALLDHDVDCLIVRTSGLFGRHGRNFVKTVHDLAVGAVQREIPVVADQVTTPTPADGFAQILQQLLLDRLAGKNLPPLLHVAGQPAVSWYAFAEKILAILSATFPEPLPKLKSVPSAQLRQPATRPSYSALDCGLAARLGYSVPDWGSALPKLISILSGKRIAA